MTGVKSPTLNDQVLDLTGEDEDEVSKSSELKNANNSEAKVITAGKSLDDTLEEIDDEITADTEAKKTPSLSTKANITLTAKVE